MFGSKIPWNSHPGASLRQPGRFQLDISGWRVTVRPPKSHGVPEQPYPLPTLAKRRSTRMRMGGLILLLVALLLASGLEGCATFRGLGEDIQHLGKKLEDKASR
jgi:predicted small secreted protein